MKKVDLHVHSKYSNHPSEWFLQKLGASESYTEPEFIYETCKSRGMDFVTITDHNSIGGALELQKTHPEDTFISVESTVYFPEDNGKIHILIYDITKEQFSKIQGLRKDIYKLRDYIKENNLAYSVAHATYSVNGTLKVEHLEKLILLFDTFESINGGRNERSNIAWTEFLKKLSKEEIEFLYEKHKIETYSETSWIKSFTAGSDDHAGIFLGRTFTIDDVKNKDEFLKSIKNRKTTVMGRHNDYKSLAFTIYKIAYDFAKRRGGNITGSFFSKINSYIFEDKKMTWKDRLRIKKLKGDKKRGKKIKAMIAEFVDEMRKEKEFDLERRLDKVYDNVGEITDEFLKLFVNAMEKHLKKGDFFNVVKDISSSIPGLFICVPFITTFKHMFNTREIVNDLKKNLGKEISNKSKKIVWFTDTLTDLNGVSVTLKKIGWISEEKNKNLRIVACLADDELNKFLPPNIINATPISQFNLPYYEKYKMKIPSFLKTLKAVYDFDPDEVYISTPGPVGLLGLAISKLLNAKSIGIYHTDFTLQSKEIGNNNASLMNMLEGYTKWFYKNVDEIKVPTAEYIRILGDRGFDTDKMKIFKRGIENDVFSPEVDNENILSKNFAVEKGVNLLYAGRISKDKHLEFLIDNYLKLKKEHKDINLILAGDGPDLEFLKKKYKNQLGLHFLGKIEYSNLPKIYSDSDLFVFPSITDTFGMVVLEAQSCGVPALVSDIGGPKEIVIDGKTGFVAKALDEIDWQKKLNLMINMYKGDREEYEKMKKASYEMVREKFTWSKVLEDIYEG